MTTGRINQVAFVAVLARQSRGQRIAHSSFKLKPATRAARCNPKLPAAISNQDRFITKLLVCLHLQSLLRRQSDSSEADHLMRLRDCYSWTRERLSVQVERPLQLSGVVPRVLTPHELAYRFRIAVGIAYSYNRIVSPAQAHKTRPYSWNHIEINKERVLDAFTRKYQLSPNCH